MTAPAPPREDVDFSLLLNEDIVIAMPCEVEKLTAGKLDPCDLEAEWILTGPCHPSCESYLLCPSHKDAWQGDPRPMFCITCGAVGSERYERIKP